MAATAAAHRSDYLGCGHTRNLHHTDARRPKQPLAVGVLVVLARGSEASPGTGVLLWNTLSIARARSKCHGSLSEVKQKDLLHSTSLTSLVMRRRVLVAVFQMPSWYIHVSVLCVVAVRHLGACLTKVASLV